MNAGRVKIRPTRALQEIDLHPFSDRHHPIWEIHVIQQRGTVQPS